MAETGAMPYIVLLLRYIVLAVAFEQLYTMEEHIGWNVHRYLQGNPKINKIIAH